MIPILFEESATQFNTNGIGRLSDAISCTASEERNGMYELELEYPSTGIHYSDIVNRSIIAAVPYRDADIQPFRVYQISRPIGGRVRINARHISYDLAKNTAMPFNVAASSSACNNTLQGLKTNAVETCPFTFWTDVTTNASYRQAIPSSIRQRLGGIEGSVLDQFGGEYEWDKYAVKLHRNRGSDNGVVLRYGKNITDLTQEEIISETVTGVVPYWIDMDGNNLVTLPEKAVYSQYASRYSTKLTVPLDLSLNYQKKPDAATLRTAAQAYVTKNNLGVPTVSVKVSFVNLADTIEYSQLESLQSVHLCDTITVQFEKLGIDTKAKISAYEWDVLKEKYKNITVGALRTTLATEINDQNNAISSTVSQAEKAINNATNWLTATGGYVIAQKNEDGTWESLVFASSIDITAENTQCLKINKNGIGFSSTGILGPYKQGWTCDGKLLIGGSYAPSITIHDANGNIIGSWTINGIDIKKGAIKGSTIELGGNNNVNGSMTIKGANGTVIGSWNNAGIDIKKGTIKGPTIELGGNNNVNGSMTIKDANGTVIGTWNKDGISVTGGTISGATIKGSTIRFGDDTNYAEMKWARIGDTPLDLYHLVIQANSGRTISLESDYGGKTGSVYVNSGSAGIMGESVTILGHVNGSTSIQGNDVTVKGWQAGKFVNSNIVLGTFESGGSKYLEVYTDNGDGTATPYGGVLLS